MVDDMLRDRCQKARLDGGVDGTTSKTQGRHRRDTLHNTRVDNARIETVIWKYDLGYSHANATSRSMLCIHLAGFPIHELLPKLPYRIACRPLGRKLSNSAHAALLRHVAATILSRSCICGWCQHDRSEQALALYSETLVTPIYSTRNATVMFPPSGPGLFRAFP
ncbi:hypothetical protein BCR34DRAFT_130124 [Clohesyomyces aquaticus]|uniref:Uncharacterized protein n=1 Tax=Clohesyomyces aquaticus TaxID=1231657 RepID=A0A1Y2AA89_9PLEO|nr:hypothetical protein BCR34DRAFT_130124 [Clohesyomyces aquaticus]